MNDINSVSITGNLTAEPELRATRSGTAVLNFRIASNYSRKKDGEWVSVPNFVGCVVLGARAEPLSRLLGKGDRVAIQGQLRYREWEHEGQKRSIIEILAEQVVLMTRHDGQQQYQQPAQQQDRTPDMYDYDVPF